MVDVPFLHDGDGGVAGETDRMVTSSEVAGVTGETDRMGAWSEVGIKSCNAGTDSALETLTKSCDAGTDAALKMYGRHCRRANVFKYSRVRRGPAVAGQRHGRRHTRADGAESVANRGGSTIAVHRRGW